MRKWNNRFLAVILALIFILGNVETAFAQTDLFGETDIISEEGPGEGYASEPMQEQEETSDAEDAYSVEAPADDEEYSAGEDEGSVYDDPAYTEEETVAEDLYETETEEEESTSLLPDASADKKAESAGKTDDEEFATGYERSEDYRDPDTVEENTELLKSSYIEPRYVDEDILNAIPLRNQNPYATCWAMASIGLAEFSLYKQGIDTAPDLSELHLAYFTYNSVVDPLGGTAGDQSVVTVSSGSIRNHGGDYGNAANALAGWLGAVEEEKAPYSEAASINSGGSLSESLAFDDAYHLRNMYRLNLRSNPGEVKKLIKEHGAAGISFYVMNSTSGATSANLYNESTNSYYCEESRSPNHGAMIVGWDDSYSRENFTKDPGCDGAWLVRNSWTTGYYSDKQQYKGYFWLSYMDRGLSSEAMVFDFERADDYANNYQFDGSVQSNPTSTVIKGANVFTVSSPAGGVEELGAVAIASFGTNVSYTVDIYKDLKDLNNPESGTKVTSESGAFVYEGYHRVELSDPVELEKDDVFSVVVSLDGGEIQYEKRTSTNSFATLNSNAEKGQSFKAEGSSWKDFGESQKGNLRIKAFTNDIGIGSDETITDIIFADEPGTGVLTINKGDSFEVGYEALPETAADKRVTWSSADKSIATVDSHGVVTAVAKGSTTITATAKVGGLSRSFEVIVTRNLTGLSITSPEEGILTAGSTYPLTAEAYPAAAECSGNITWTSSDPEIAAVDANGNLVVSGTGEILLTAEADGVSGTGSYMCILANPVISAKRTGNTVSISIDTVTGASGYVIYRKIPGESGSTASEIGSISVTQGQEVYEFSDDITGLEIPKGYLEYEVKASSAASESRSSVKVPVTKRAYTITYDAGVGKNPASNPLKLIDGEKIQLDLPIAPPGYSSIGWYEPNFDGIIRSLPLKQWSKDWYTDYTLTAVYKANQYRILYYPNGGTGAMHATTVAYGDRISLPINTFTRQGSTFTGWNTEPDGKGTSYKNKESVIDLTTENGGIIRLYAQWKTPVTSIKLSDSSLIMYTGESRTITETVLPMHANNKEVEWSSSKTGVATVDPDGVVTALSNGVTTITCLAKDGSGKKATCSVTVKTHVTDVKISAAERLAVGKTYKVIPSFNEGGVEPSDKTLSWSVSDSFVATISQSGVVTALNPGTVTIKAVSPERDPDNKDIEGSCDIRVYEPVSSVSFGAKTASVGGKGTLMLGVTLTPAVKDDDPEYQGVSFISSNPEYLGVEEVMDGKTAKLKANLPDDVDKATVKVTATAKDGSGKSATCTVTVVRQVAAITVSAPNGQDMIAVGKKLKLMADVTPDNAVNKKVEWGRSDPSVASVDKSGNVKAVSVGNAVITAKSVTDSTIYGTYAVSTYTALNGIALNSSSVTVHAGNTYKLEIAPKPADAVMNNVTYSVTSGDKYISIDESGLITAMENLDGKTSQRATVTVKADDGVTVKTAVCSVTITKDPVSVKSVKLSKTSLVMGLGARETIRASVIPDSADIKDLETPVTDKTGIVNVTDNGDGSYDIEAVGPGTVGVRFVSKSNPSRSATCRITVGNPVGSVAITSAPGRLVVGKKATLRSSVNGNGTKAANTSVNWTIISAKDTEGNDVDDTSKIATVSSKGVVSANGAGTVTVRATAEKPYGIDDTDARYFAECTIETYVPVSGMTVNRTSINIKLNETKVIYISSVRPDNATHQNVVWTSSNPNIVKVIEPESASTDAALGETLKISAVGIGKAKITGMTADGSKKKVTVNVKVTGCMMESDVAMTVKEIPNGVTVDNSSLGTRETVITNMPVKKTVTLTPVLTETAFCKNVSFRSSDPNVATVSAKGVVTAKNPGTAIITMRTADGGFEARCTVSVSD